MGMDKKSMQRRGRVVQAEYDTDIHNETFLADVLMKEFPFMTRDDALREAARVIASKKR